MVACGGGGGGGDDGADPCESYCQFACAKSANCGFYDSSELDDCTSSCLDTNEATDAQCTTAQIEFENMTCSEIAVLLGFARTARNGEYLPNAVEVGAMCGVLPE